MRDDGYVKIVGRIKDMIIRGGQNIYPAEIEGVLNQLEDIIDVQVVGVPSKRLGEEVSYIILTSSDLTLGCCLHSLERGLVRHCHYCEGVRKVETCLLQSTKVCQVC